MTAPERCVTFRCGGDEVVGVLHLPDRWSGGEAGFLIVVGGPQYRVGSHRQFVLMARMLASAGYPVFRFDYRGMGDSTGTPRCFEDIHSDIDSALGAFQSAVPAVRRIVLFGLCDSASAALMYGSTDSRVSQLVLANPWVRTEVGEARALVKHYYRTRLMQRSFWRKLLTGDVKLVGAMQSLGTLLSRARFDAQSIGTRVDYIDRMAEGLSNFRGRILILISGRDLTAKQFEDLCAESPRWRTLTSRPSVTWVRISNADHTFSNSVDLVRALQACLAWISPLSEGSFTGRL